MAYFAFFYLNGDSGGGRSHESLCETGLYAGGSWPGILTLQTAIASHSLCSKGHVIRQTGIGDSEARPEAGANIDNKAVIYFRDPDTLEVLHFGYAAPIAADVETTSAGKRIKQSVVSDIVGYINTFKGTAYVPLYGVYYQRTN